MSKNKSKTQNKKDAEKNAVEKNDVNKAELIEEKKTENTEENKNDSTQAENITVNTASKSTQEEEEERPPLTRREKLFSVFDKFGDLFVLNMVFFVTCLPIITIGPSFIALYTVTNKMVRNIEGPVFQEYWKAFKANLKQGIVIWSIDLAYLISMYIQYVYYCIHDNQASKILFIVLGFEFVLFAFAFPLQFPLTARYENTSLNMIKNALALSLAHLGVWFRMFFIWMFPVALYYLRPNLIVYTWYLWVFVLVAIFTYVCSMFLMEFYKKIENREEPAN